MDLRKENKDNKPKKKKPNIFQRFGYRISRYLQKSKTSDLTKQEDFGISKSCLDNLPVTSKSQDHLNLPDSFKCQRNSLCESLNVPKRNDRSFSVGDLTREESQFSSLESSPQISKSGICESNINDSVRIEPTCSGAFNPRNGHLFKNELALKLRAKSQPKNDDSDRPKTPESPTAIGTGTSPSRQLCSEARTPRSMSSLSHSSNSLLSGSVATNYGASDAESMSRSAIDCHDDAGIVVDLATPMSQTTSSALLDSTAARQKISASKARRARPKAATTPANASSAGDSKPTNESAQFSPAREKCDILEEIREEDSSPTIVGKDIVVVAETCENINPPSCPSPAIIIVENVVSIDKTESNQSDSSVANIVLIDNIKSNQSDSSVAHIGLIDKNDSDLSDSSVEDAHMCRPTVIGDSLLQVSPKDDTSMSLSQSPPTSTAHNLFTDKPKIESHKEKPDSSPRLFVKLRPTANRSAVNSTVNTYSSANRDKSPAAKDEHHDPDLPKVIRYTHLRPSKDTAKTTQLTADGSLSNSANKDSLLSPEHTPGYGDKRASRVMNLIKNFESVPCTDTN